MYRKFSIVLVILLLLALLPFLFAGTLIGGLPAVAGSLDP